MPITQSTIVQINTGFFRFFYLILLSSATAAHAQSYDLGNGALQVWNTEAMAQSATWLKVWLAVLGLSFALGLFFVRRHKVARWIVGGFAAGLVVSGVLPNLLGIPALSGLIALIHLIFWSPGLYMLLTKRPFLSPNDWFSRWSGLITAVILFSFFFDIRDAVIYLSHLVYT